MLDRITYDGLYTKLSGAIVIWENEAKRSGRDPDTVDDRRIPNQLTKAFIGYGAQYANPVVTKRQSSRSFGSHSAFPGSYSRNKPT